MRLSNFFLSTLREAPADADVVSQKLMLRAGMIRQQAIRLTKRSLNGWMNMARPVFESSLAMEMLCFMGEDAGDVCRRHPNAVVDVARPQGAMERTQPGHGIGIDLRDARTRTATGSLPSARMSSI